jgi:biotin transporter BioY
MKIIVKVIYYLLLLGLNAGAAYYMGWLYFVNKTAGYFFSFLESPSLTPALDDNELLFSLIKYALVLIGIVSVISLLLTLVFKRWLGFDSRMVMRVSIIQVVLLSICCSLIFIWVYHA